MLNEKILNEILEAKEDRRLKQEEIISRYPFSLVSFTLNIPGEIKDSPLYRRIHREGMKELYKLLEKSGGEIIHKEVIYKITGVEGFISVDMYPMLLKVLSISIEESHPLGRIFDIDIFQSNLEQVSRIHISKEPRKCLLCEDSAINCIRLQKHNSKELLEKIQNISIEYFR